MALAGLSLKVFCENIAVLCLFNPLCKLSNVKLMTHFETQLKVTTYLCSNLFPFSCRWSVYLCDLPSALLNSIKNDSSIGWSNGVLTLSVHCPIFLTFTETIKGSCWRNMSGKVRLIEFKDNHILRQVVGKDSVIFFIRLYILKWDFAALQKEEKKVGVWRKGKSRVR